MVVFVVAHLLTIPEYSGSNPAIGNISEKVGPFQWNHQKIIYQSTALKNIKGNGPNPKLVWKHTKKLFKKFISFHELSLKSVTPNASGQLAVDNGSNRHSLLSKPLKVVAPIKCCLKLLLLLLTCTDFQLSVGK